MERHILSALEDIVRFAIPKRAQAPKRSQKSPRSPPA